MDQSAGGWLRRITVDLLPSTSPVLGESCERSGLIKSPKLDLNMPQGGKRYKSSYSKDDGDGFSGYVLSMKPTAHA